MCVIFDLDGTLVDTERACNQAFLDLIPDLDGPVESLVARYRGGKLAEILSDIEARLGRSLGADFVEVYRRRVRDLFQEDFRSMPGAEAVLSALSCAVCVASSGPRDKIEDALRLAALDRFFIGRIFSAYEIGLWKPDPGFFLHVARAMGFPPDRCVAVDDSSVGVEAALAAGMQAIHFCPEDTLANVGARRISDLTELIDLLVAPAAGPDDGVPKTVSPPP